MVVLCIGQYNKVAQKWDLDETMFKSNEPEWHIHSTADVIFEILFSIEHKTKYEN